MAFCVAVFLMFFVWLAGLLGRRIAIASKHPDPEAVKIMGYVSLLPLVPWIHVRNMQLANRITLHLALGGSFDSEPATTVSAAHDK